LLQFRHLARSQLERTATRLACPNGRQVFVVKRQLGEILDPRWVRKTTNRENIRTLLQLFDPTHPGYKPIAIDVDGNRSENGDLRGAARYNANNRFSLIELTAIDHTERQRWLKEREGVAARRRQWDFEREQREHGRRDENSEDPVSNHALQVSNPMATASHIQASLSGAWSQHPVIVTIAGTGLRQSQIADTVDPVVDRGTG
jgi:hypothetical protein